MFERRGTVLFDHKMREPRERVTDDQENRKEVPSTRCDKPYQQCNSERRARKVQSPRHRLAVLAHVEIPKFAIALDRVAQKFLLTMSATMTPMNPLAPTSTPPTNVDASDDNTTLSATCISFFANLAASHAAPTVA